MSEKLASRQKKLLNEMPDHGELLLFSDQLGESFQKSGSSIIASSFVRLGMKGATFKDCSFTQSNFEDSYFRRAAFINVRFTGSSFRCCNFEKASFQTCDFRYCTFYYCKLPKEEVISCFPSEPNLRRDLARNLRANFDMIGDKKTADFFLNAEIQAHEDELKAIFLSKTSYYKQHYDVFGRLGAGLNFISSKLSGLIWGYGHRVKNLLISYMLFTFVLSLITYFGKIKFIINRASQARSLTFWESISTVFCETVNATTQSVTPLALAGQVITLSASLLGTLFLALLAATLYRKIAR